MGGNIFLYLIFLVIIPVVFQKIQKRGNKLSWVTSLVSVIYTGIIVYIAFPEFNETMLVFYLVLCWTFFRYCRVKSLFFTQPIIKEY